MNEQDVFLAARAEANPAQRAAYLEEIGNRDPGLRARVERLLKAATEPDNPLSGLSLITRPTTVNPRQQPGPRAANALALLPPKGYHEPAEIARGGMGVVYGAYDKALNRWVAVKVMHPGQDAGRFVVESKVTAQLPHPGIPPVYALGELADGRPFLAMKWVDGGTLSDELEVTDEPRLLDIFERICETVGYAHAQRIVHRDLKPSNVMIGAFGEVLVMDWGLAKVIGAAEPGATTPDMGATTSEDVARTVAGAVKGTPTYMAPEQARGESIDCRADVFALGGILVAILTGKPPFTGDTVFDVVLKAARADLEDCYSRLGECDADDELLDIAERCLEARPDDRYADGAAVAAAVAKYRAGVEARIRKADQARAAAEVTAGEQRKRRRVQAVLAVALLTIVTGGAAFAVWQQYQSGERTRIEGERKRIEGERIAAEERGKAEEERRKRAEAEGRIQNHAALLTAIQLSRLNRDPHVGWSRESIKQVGQAEIRTDVPLRSQAVALLQGIDAVPRQQWRDVYGSSLAFATDGRLLIGGPPPDKESRPAPTRLWDGTSDSSPPAKVNGMGPVAFRKDTPVQLTTAPGGLALRAVDVPRVLCSFPVPKFDTAVKGIMSMALSPDGRFAAASLVQPDEKGRTLVWDADTGAVLLDAPLRATALVVAPAGTDGEAFVAGGDKTGTVTVWSLPDGKQLSSLPVDHGAVKALALGRDVRRSERAPAVPALRNWLLGVGGETGRVSVWSLESSQPRSFGHGSHNAVYTLAFAPDATTLLSAGRGEPRLWDVATGRLLLQLKHMDYVSAVAFAPDGRSVAVTGHNLFSGPGGGGTEVWRLENGRGTQSLRGLVGAVACVRWSPDGKLLAAVSHDWRVAVWDREQDRLLHVFEPTPGRFSDNIGAAFSPDGRHLAYSTGKNAFRWDLTTGKQLDKWELGEGLCDQLLYAGGDLYSFRVETTDPRRAPVGLSPPNQYPRVCTIRRLVGPKLDPNKWEPVAASQVLGWDVRSSAAAGACFAAEGWTREGGELVRSIKAFDAATGAVLWSEPSATPLGQAGPIVAETTGKLVSFSTGPDRHHVFDARTGREVESSALSYQAVSAVAPDNFRITSGGTLRRRGKDAILFRLAIDDYPDPNLIVFSPNDARVAWTTPDGLVRVCDLNEAQKRLKAMGLRW